MTLVRAFILSCCLMAVGGSSVFADQAGVGTASKVVNDVSGLLEGAVRELSLEDRVYLNEVIESGADSATEIVFRDGTRLRMGPLSRITLNAVVFDPEPAKSRFTASLQQGVFQITSGTLPKDRYRFETPTGTIGIRGTVFTVLVMSPEIEDWLERVRPAD